MKAKEAAEIIKGIEEVRGSLPEDGLLVEEALNMAIKALELFGISEQLPSAQPEIVRCCKCSYWDRDSLRHRCNDFRDWNEAECKILAERDPYDEINRYTEADDYCSRAERKHDE